MNLFTCEDCGKDHPISNQTTIGKCYECSEVYQHNNMNDLYRLLETLEELESMAFINKMYGKAEKYRLLQDVIIDALAELQRDDVNQTLKLYETHLIINHLL